MDVKIEASWKEVLKNEFAKPYFLEIVTFLKTEKTAGKILYPPGPLIFNAFNQTPFDRVKVVILGQDPYHGPGQAHAKSPKKPGLITREPKPDMCARSCHHPPHVEGFDATKAKQFIVGPGHGMPENAPWPAWATDGGNRL